MEVIDLVKRYPKSPVNAVDGITFAVAPGEVFGLLRQFGLLERADVKRDLFSGGQAQRVMIARV